MNLLKKTKQSKMARIWGFEDEWRNNTESMFSGHLREVHFLSRYVVPIHLVGE